MNTNRNTVVTLFVLVIVALIVASFFSFPAASAMGTDGTSSRYYTIGFYPGAKGVCNTVDNNKTAAYDGHTVDQLDANTRHCETPKSDYVVSFVAPSVVAMPIVRPVVVEPTSTDDDDVVVVTPIVTPVVDVPVVVVDETPVVVVDEPVVTPEAPVTETCGNGNPGNHKCVGNSGENPNNKGTMDNDSTDGNGEHGNQGVNTKGNGNTK